MTRSESIMSRWSRMKQQSAGRATSDDLSPASRPADAEAGDLSLATAATPATDAPASPAFDPASLPLLQSITAGTDIRSFLASNVPLELTRAALRRDLGNRSGHPRVHRDRREPMGFQRPNGDAGL
jgi:hypothetical protein